MKILHVINSLEMGGAEKLVVELLPLLQKSGIECDVLLLKGTEDMLLLEQLKQYLSINIFILGRKSVYNPTLVFRIMPYLRQYDLIHVHLFPSLYWVAIAAFLSKLAPKLVYTEHSTSNRRHKYFLFKMLDRLLYRKYHHIVSISREADQKLRCHLGVMTNPSSVVHNGVNIEAVKNAIAYPKSDFFNISDTLLIQVSSFRYPKDQATVIRALTQLPENIKLLLVGEGSLKVNCEQLVEELGLKDRIKFLGLRTDVARLLKTADIIILSSHYEGLSLSSIEGLASGKPFIASDVLGLTEIVLGAGVLFPKNSYQELACQIRKLIGNEEYYKKTSEICQIRALEYDINNTLIGYSKLYQELM